MGHRFFVRIGGWICIALLWAGVGPKDASSEQQTAPGLIGWYNGDWQSGLPGQPNWYFSPTRFSRVYDDFVVPAGGWTVRGVFSDNHIDFSGVTKAAWEIRRDMMPGKGGQKVASGLSRATQVPIPGEGPFPGDPSVSYRVQVDGLHIHLAPGRYWLSVAPVVTGKGLSYANSTLGKNAIGDPAGNNGRALVVKPELGVAFSDAGQFGKARDFSQGVILDAGSAKKEPLP